MPVAKQLLQYTENGSKEEWGGGRQRAGDASKNVINLKLKQPDF